MPVQRQRRWTGIDPALDQDLPLTSPDDRGWFVGDCVIRPLN